MAVLNFPDPAAQTPANTFSPTSTPDATSNGVTYVWTDGSWSIAGVSNGGFLDKDEADSYYVEQTGDNMTGSLTIGPNGGTSKFSLNEANNRLTIGNYAENQEQTELRPGYVQINRDTATDESFGLFNCATKFGGRSYPRFLLSVGGGPKFGCADSEGVRIVSDSPVGTTSYGWSDTTGGGGALEERARISYDMFDDKLKYNSAGVDRFQILGNGTIQIGNDNLATDSKITLGASDGSASFAAGKFTVNSNGRASSIGAIGGFHVNDINQTNAAFAVSDSDGSNTYCTIMGSGSALFAGNVNSNANVIIEGVSPENGFYARVGDSGDWGAKILANGSATFAGSVTFPQHNLHIGDVNNATYGSTLIHPYTADLDRYVKAGWLYSNTPSRNGSWCIFNRQQVPKGTNPDTLTWTPTIRFDNSGSAEFNGSITGTFNVWSSTQSVTFADGAASTSKGLRVGTVSAPENAYIQADGNASFVSTRAAGFIIETERDNDANYVSTTDADGNQTLVYNGPTLDVKERLQNLLARVDAMEANEIVDDATDSSLLQLVASLTARLDEKDAAIASLTSSLTALTSRVTTLET